MATFSPRREGEPERSDRPSGPKANVPSPRSSQMPCVTSPRRNRPKVGRRKAKLRSEAIGGPCALAHFVGEAELDRGVSERRGVIGLDLRPQPLLGILDSLDFRTWLSHVECQAIMSIHVCHAREGVFHPSPGRGGWRARRRAGIAGRGDSAPTPTTPIASSDLPARGRLKLERRSFPLSSSGEGGLDLQVQAG